MAEKIIKETEILLAEEGLQSMRELYNQYRKELADLENRKGLAKVMSISEIRNTIPSLKHHIHQLDIDIQRAEIELDNLKREKEAM